MLPIYVVSYKNEERRQRMTERFKKLNLDHNVIFTPEVHTSDIRLVHIPQNLQRNCSIMLQHLDSLSKFLETKHEYCIVCEDDVYISKYLSEKLPTFVYDCNVLNLDILLLGYILPFRMDMTSDLHKHHFPYYNNASQKIYMNHSHHYHNYPNDLWGSQMYIISRKYAQFLVHHYNLIPENQTLLHAIQNGQLAYSPDWIITKKGNHALLYPMLAVEEHGINYDNSTFLAIHYNTDGFY